jgi:hypothetical protein
MSAELYGYAAPDAVMFVVAWLLPLGDTWSTPPKSSIDTNLPYRVVNRVAGETDSILFTDDVIVSVHCIGATYAEARDCAREADRRMDLLAHSCATVSLPDNTVAAPDYVETLQKPIHMDYGDTALERFVARYKIGLSYVAV